jgi:D-alanyl-lipoteichoic acid acyltransferase DltB (MBOAT superfamily)
VLFNSYAFLLAFLPATYIGFYCIARRWAAAANLFLALASLFFYGWWDWRYVPLLVGSVAFNYCAARQLIGAAQGNNPGRVRAWLTLAVAADLALLGVFKYADFFVSSADALGAQIPLLHVALPLGISFFTFTQIAYQVDIARGEVERLRPIDYALFVTYFPHLIAGPVLHHREMMPQFAGPAMHSRNPHLLDVGLAVFAFGLAKKTLLADTIAPYADAVFGAAAAGTPLLAAEAWGGALAYAFQLYFDFSGYCDMAVGLSLLFGVRLPVNFLSPYKAANIIDFWRRWHMTLSRFLRDYLYIPLGGKRLGPLRRHLNLMLTMLLGGLWHGAGWTFVVWGGLHGLYLVINHGWRALCGRRPGLVPLFAGWRGTLLTFFATVLAWVFFRAASFGAAAHMLGAMFGGDHALRLATSGENWRRGALLLALLGGIIWAMPNVSQIFSREQPVLESASIEPARRYTWRPTALWWLASGLLLAGGLLTFHRNSPFLYFQF